MAAPPRPLSPAEKQALRREDARYLMAPLDTRSGPRSMAAHLRYAARQLSDAASPIAGAVARLLALQELTTPPHPAIVCRRGCSLCCSQNVTVTAPEAFYLAETLRADPALAAAVLAADETLNGLAAGRRAGPERFGKVACPLLVDHACAVYAQRPMACRAFVSVDYRACVSTFADHRPVDIPMPEAHTHTLFAVRMLLMAALRLAGLDDATYELTAAVATALREPDAEARWRAGEPVFAAIAANPPIPPQADAQIRQMVAHVAGTF